jgi:hypothetical protein
MDAVTKNKFYFGEENGVEPNAERIGRNGGRAGIKNVASCKCERREDNSAAVDLDIRSR